MTSDSFDPYHRWLGIPSTDQLPDHYRMLGVERFECDTEVIHDAADRQMAHVRTYQLGAYSALSQEVLNRLAAARVCLLDPQKKSAYDQWLLQQPGVAPVLQPQSVSAPLTTTTPSPATDPFPSGQSITGRHDSSNLRSQSAVFLVLGGAAASFVLGALVWWFVVGFGSRQEQQPDQTVILGPNNSFKEVVPPLPLLPPPPPPPSPPPPSPQSSPLIADDAWLDALIDTATCGPVAVRVVSVQLGKPRITRSAGRTSVPSDECLIITLELTNTDPAKKLVYQGWGGWMHALYGAVLIDNYKNRYEMKRFTGSSIEGQQRNTSIYPNSPLNDVLVFERPVKAAEYLRLTLPASAIGQEGDIQFEIPRRMFEAEHVEPLLAQSGEAIQPEQADMDDENGHSQALPAARKPVPSALEQETIRRMVDEIYGTTASCNPKERRELQGKLSALAKKAEDATERFVLLRRASELASDRGDGVGMLQMVEQIAEEFEVDRLAAQAAMLDGFAKKNTSEDQIRALVVSASSVIDEAIDTEQFDLADSLSAVVFRACQTSAGRAFRGEAMEHRREVQKLRDRWNEVQVARGALESVPEDSAAHTILARWYCFVRNDWNLALPHLAKSSEPKLRALANRELSIPAEDVTTQVGLADSWWELAQESDADSKPVWAARAAYWYETAWPRLASPLLKAKVQKRLGELGRPDPNLPRHAPEDLARDHSNLFPPGERRLSDLLEEPEGSLLEREKQKHTPPGEGEDCPVCKGKGIVYTKCPNRMCARGTVRDYRYQVVGVNPASGQAITQRVPVRVRCPVCKGDYIKKETCSECGGSGKK